jgi:hypothetical protein
MAPAPGVASLITQVLNLLHPNYTSRLTLQEIEEAESLHHFLDLIFLGK